MAFAPRCTRRRAKGLLESLLLFYIRRLRLIPLLILPVRVGLDILPIWIGFWTSEVNGRGVLALEDVNVCPKLVHTSTSCVAFNLWRHPRLRRDSGMLGLTRSFRDWHGRSFRAVRGIPLRGTPLHSASDKGSSRLDGVRGPPELEVIRVHPVREWRYSTEVIDGSLLAEADNGRPQHLSQTQKSFPTTIRKLSPLYWKHCQIGGQ